MQSNLCVTSASVRACVRACVRVCVCVRECVCATVSPDKILRTFLLYKNFNYS